MQSGHKIVGVTRDVDASPNWLVSESDGPPVSTNAGEREYMRRVSLGLQRTNKLPKDAGQELWR